MRSRHAPAPLIFLLLNLSACSHTPPAGASSDLSGVRAAIEAANMRVAAAVMRGDAAAIAQIVAEDGEAIATTEKGFVSGRPALEAYYAGRLRAARFRDVVITTVAVEVAGDLAWETGRNRLTVQVGDAPPTTRTGRYLVVWKRQPDGRWLIRVDAVIPDPAG